MNNIYICYICYIVSYMTVGQGGYSFSHVYIIIMITPFKTNIESLVKRVYIL